MSRESLDRLSSELVRFAKMSLDEFQEICPLGATLTGGQLQFYAVDGDSGTLDYREQREHLRQLLREEAESSDCEAVGFYCDVTVHRGGLKQDAIQCFVEHRDGTSFEQLTPYNRIETAGISFGEAETTDGQQGVLGYPQLQLILENRLPIRSPRMNQLVAAVDAMTPNGRPGFLILECESRDYCQTEGGLGQFTVEWRQYTGDDFVHWIAGLPSESVGQNVDIQTNGSFVTVRSNEVLSREDALVILTAFLKGNERPSTYSWREMTWD